MMMMVCFRVCPGARGARRAQRPARRCCPPGSFSGRCPAGPPPRRWSPCARPLTSTRCARAPNFLPSPRTPRRLAIAGVSPGRALTAPDLASHRLQVFARDASTLPVTFQHRGTGGRSSIRCARARRRDDRPATNPRRSGQRLSLPRASVFSLDAHLDPTPRTPQRHHGDGVRRHRIPRPIRGEPHRQERVAHDPPLAMQRERASAPQGDGRPRPDRQPRLLHPRRRRHQVRRRAQQRRREHGRKGVGDAQLLLRGRPRGFPRASRRDLQERRRVPTGARLGARRRCGSPLQVLPHQGGGRRGGQIRLPRRHHRQAREVDRDGGPSAERLRRAHVQVSLRHALRRRRVQTPAGFRGRRGAGHSGHRGGRDDGGEGVRTGGR